MIVCPLCQHQQAQGVECDVCGRPFPETMVEERGHAPPPVEVVPGLETTQIADPPRTAPPPQNAQCNWCGHAQASGRVCDNCGRQRLRGQAPESASATAPVDDTPMGVCRDCGFPSPPPRCVNCGTRVDLPETGA